MDNQNDGSPRAGVYPGAGRSQISRPHATQANQGSLAWRYYLIEEVPEMPFVSVDYLHEIVFGCIQIVRYTMNGCLVPSRYTHS